MKTITFALAVLLSAAVTAQDSLQVIAFIGGGASSYFDERVAWDVWKEPKAYLGWSKPVAQRMAEKGLGEAYIDSSRATFSRFVVAARGTDGITIPISEEGFYHLTAYDVNTGDTLAYTYAFILSRGERYITTGVKQKAVFEENQKTAVYAPFLFTSEPLVGLRQPGLVKN